MKFSFKRKADNLRTETARQSVVGCNTTREQQQAGARGERPFPAHVHPGPGLSLWAAISGYVTKIPCATSFNHHAKEESFSCLAYL